MVQKTHSSTLLDTMITMLFDHYACIKLPQMTGYVRKFEGNTTMSLNISNKKMLKKHNQYGKELKSY